MRITFDTTYNTSFRTIRLSEKEIQKSEKIFKELLDENCSLKRQNGLKNKLFDIFSPHIAREAYYKSRRYHYYEEVLSEIYLRFAELLNKIKAFSTVELFLDAFNNYKLPKKNEKPMNILTLDRVYEKDFDDHIMHLKIIDLVTEDDLPNPTSAKQISKMKMRLQIILDNTEFSEVVRKRIEAKAEGATYQSLSDSENISITSVRNSIRKGILKIQKKFNIIPEECLKKVRILSSKLGCDENKVLNMVILNPEFLFQNPDTICERVKQSSQVLNCTFEKFVNLSLRSSSLLLIKPESLDETVMKMAAMLKCSREKFIKLAMDQPQLLYQRPETIRDNICKSSELLGCTEEKFIKAAFKLPSILCRKPISLLKNVGKASAFLKCTKEEFIKAGLGQPQLFTQNTATILNNVIKASKLLHCSQESFTAAALKQGQLFLYKPETLLRNVRKSARLVNMTDYAYTNAALSRPLLFFCKPETLAHKLKITDYYNKLQNRFPIQKSVDVSSDKKLYSEILRLFLRKMFPDETFYYVKRFNFDQFLQLNKDKFFVFEIPDDEIVEEFISAIQELSQKAIGKNIFEFKIVEEIHQ